MLKGRS